MPFSQSSQLSLIVNFLESTQPQSILDVGTSMGQYGFLARTNLQHLTTAESEANPYENHRSVHTR